MPTAVASAIDLPFKEAADFFRQKARVPTEHWTDVWRTAHSHSFMVAGAATDALLTDFQTEIQKALDEGATLADFRKSFDAIVEKHGWAYNGAPGWRSQIIYETNLSTAYSAGRYAQLTEPDTRAAFPFWQYEHSGSSHPRLQHLAWNGLTLRCDDSFWETHYPPNGWRCGCRVRPVSQGGLGRMGKSEPDAAPPVQTRPWANPKTGQVHAVPVGIDPGFDYNPGQAWKQGGSAIPVKAPDLVEQRPPGSLNPATPKQIVDFVRNPHGHLPVGRMATETQQALGAQTDMVLLSADTMEKQLSHHAELSEEDYARLPVVLSQPDAVMEKGERRILLLRLEENVMAAVLKATASGDGVYVVSYHRVRPKGVASYVRKQRLLLGGTDRLLGGE